ncbi:ADP-ribosylation factor-like protein 6-interacting protein 4 isoform X2 [Coccinella septempunctata]|uniref:ADP-ribosylation factor-like protein 6-interacting protein 4 isoform X2 n=1 Tax=Coccinella septempunctata TaxID=41139 RepID=UPI001D05FB6E|nr:ADP-ribosylation factor-like protein 6-interacting protein 4 isoform X2 [Coccinella septempunctata]
MNLDKKTYSKKEKTNIKRDRSRSSESSSNDEKDGVLKHKKRKLMKHSKSRSERKYKKGKKRTSSSDSSTSEDSSTSSSDSSSSSSEEEKKRKKKSKLISKTTKKKKPKKKPEDDGPSADIPLELMDKRKTLAPMTKEEWEKKQSVVRRVYDESTGRNRLIKGDGEVIEEIVSRDRHKQINQQATKGDGEFFQNQLKKL